MFDQFTTLEFWTPVLTSTVLIGVVGAIVAPWYKGWVERGIQSRFDEKLEKLSAELRQDEERLKAELRSQEDQLNAIRSGSLAQLSARRSSLDARRLKAIENLWASVVAKSPGRNALEFTSVLKMDSILEAAKDSNESDPNRKIGDIIWKTSGIENQINEGAPDMGALERPFVSELSWAMYEAYGLAVVYPIVQLAAIRTGMDGSALNNSDAVLKPIREALPGWEEFIDKYGTSGLKQLASALELKLLNQLKRDLNGIDDDEKSIESARKIVELAEAARNRLSPSPENPDEMKSESPIVRS